MAFGYPLTVAGAVTALAPFGSSVPCSLLIPWTWSVGEPSTKRGWHRRGLRVKPQRSSAAAVVSCVLWPVGDRLDLDLDVDHQIGAHRGARRRILGEELGIDRVEAPEVAGIGEPHRGLDDVGHRAAG